jgi:acyl-CoA synthetase (AMP-forming)/AMP-acid ligase II
LQLTGAQAPNIVRHDRASAAGHGQFDKMIFFVTGQIGLPSDVGRRLMRHIPCCTLVVAYGFTEAAGRMCCRVVALQSDLGESGTVGCAIDGLKLEIFDDDMNTCLPGEIGRVFVRGKYLFGDISTIPKKHPA